MLHHKWIVFQRFIFRIRFTVDQLCSNFNAQLKLKNIWSYILLSNRFQSIIGKNIQQNIYNFSMLIRNYHTVPWTSMLFSLVSCLWSSSEFFRWAYPCIWWHLHSFCEAFSFSPPIYWLYGSILDDVCRPNFLPASDLFSVVRFHVLLKLNVDHSIWESRCSKIFILIY